MHVLSVYLDVYRFILSDVSLGIYYYLLGLWIIFHRFSLSLDVKIMFFILHIRLC